MASLFMGTVKEDATLSIVYTTAAADGGEENFSATLEQADFTIYKDGSAMTLDASTITPSNIATGVQKVVVDLSNDADFTTGSFYQMVLDASDETIDAQAVSGQVAHWYIESASDKAIRLLRQHLYPTDSTISTTTSNTTSAINLTDIVDAQTQDDALTNLILGVHDATDDRVEIVRTTAVTSKVATVELVGDGGAMSFTVAAGDHVWILGPAEARSAIEDKFTFTSGAVQADTQYMNGTELIGAGSSGNKWRA